MQIWIHGDLSTMMETYNGLWPHMANKNLNVMRCTNIGLGYEPKMREFSE